MQNTGEGVCKKEDSKLSPWVAPGIDESGYQMITNLVCSHFDLEKKIVLTKIRKRDVVWARQIIMYLCYMHMNKQSLAEVGFRCGGFDHSTVVHARHTIINLTKSYQDVYDEVHEIEKKVIAVKENFFENKKKGAI